MRLDKNYNFHNVRICIGICSDGCLGGHFVISVQFYFLVFCCDRRSTSSPSHGVQNSASEGGATTSSSTASGVSVTTNAASGPTSPPTPTAAFVSFTPEQFAQLLGKLDEIVGTRGGESSAVQSDSQLHHHHPYRYELFSL